MDLTTKSIDLTLAILMCAALFLLSFDVMALDMPGAKVVDEGYAWMFGPKALLIATIIWVITMIAAFMPQVRQVGFGGFVLVTAMIALWFGAPTYVPAFAKLV